MDEQSTTPPAEGSEQLPADAQAPEGESQAKPEGEAPADDPRVAKANKEAADYRRKLREAEKERDALKQERMTEAERLQSRAEQAEQDRTALLKRAVLAESGLNPEAGEFLHGSTEEELLESATRFKALAKALHAGDEPPAGSKPVRPAAPGVPPGPSKTPSHTDPAAATGADLLNFARGRG